jgi:transcriptional regulator with XRE-family HTH domain
MIKKTPYSFENLEQFRLSLNLSTRDFGLLFNVSNSTLTKIKSKKTNGRHILDRIQLYERNPGLILQQIFYNGKYLKKHKIDKIISLLFPLNLPLDTLEDKINYYNTYLRGWSFSDGIPWEIIFKTINTNLKKERKENVN